MRVEAEKLCGASICHSKRVAKTTFQKSGIASMKNTDGQLPVGRKAGTPKREKTQFLKVIKMPCISSKEDVVTVGSRYNGNG